MPVSVQRLGLDLRLLLLGALLPDIIDKPLAFWLARDAVSYSTRSVGHSLALNGVLLVAATTLLARSGRAGLLAVALGSIGHLLLDGMWDLPTILLWPFLGWQFPPGSTTLDEYIRFHYMGLLRSPEELVGAVVVAWFALQVFRHHAVRNFLRTGRAE
jgi:hypothetical protein